jgi:hypothetical protein
MVEIIHSIKMFIAVAKILIFEENLIGRQPLVIVQYQEFNLKGLVKTLPFIIRTLIDFTFKLSIIQIRGLLISLYILS